MKRLYILLLLILIPTIIFAQYRYDGRRIWPATIDSTKFTSDKSAVLGPGVVGGGQLTDATLGELWLPVEWDSIFTDGGVAASAVKGAGPWSLSSFTSNQVVTGYFPAAVGGDFTFKTFGFEADGSGTDDSVCVSFPCPANYKDDTMELYLYFFHLDDDGAYTDTVACWDGSVSVTGATDSTVSVFSAGTAMTSVPHYATYTGPGGDTTSDSLLFIANMDPEVVDIDPGDFIRIYLWNDVTRSDLDSGEEVYLIGILVRWDIADVN